MLLTLTIRSILMLFGVKILLQGLLNSNSHRDSHADHGRAMRSIADRDLATCRWQVATLPMGAPMKRIFTS